MLYDGLMVAAVPTPYVSYIDVVQYDGTNGASIVEWISDFLNVYSENVGQQIASSSDVDGVLSITWVRGMPGTMVVNTGDWVYRDTLTFYVRSGESNFFELSYRPA